MSLKVKLVSMVSAFVLVLSLMLVGVLAATNVSLNVGGNVTFTASSVYADITGSYVGTAEHPTTAQSLSTISIDAETTDGAVDMSGHDDWINMPLTFDSTGSVIKVTINIKNKATDSRAILVELTDNTNITYVNVESSATSIVVNPSSTGTITLTLTLTNQNVDINNQRLDIDLDLSATQPAEQHTVTIEAATSISYTVYFKGDDGLIQYVEPGDSKTITTSVLFISLDESYLNSANISVNSIGGVEVYAPGPGGFVYTIDGVRVGQYADGHWDMVLFETEYAKYISPLATSNRPQGIIFEVPFDCTFKLGL